MCSVHPLDFNEILDVFKDKNHQIHIKPVIVLYFVIVLYTLL